MKERNENFINPDLDNDGFPIRDGVYEVREVSETGEAEWDEIDVYPNSAGNLCVLNEAGGEDDEACHVPVRFSGYNFGKRIRDLD